MARNRNQHKKHANMNVAGAVSLEATATAVGA